MHQDLYVALEEKAGFLDNAFSSLLRDLEAKGLLDKTLVVLATEFIAPNGRPFKVGGGGDPVRELLA